MAIKKEDSQISKQLLDFETTQTIDREHQQSSSEQFEDYFSNYES